MDKSNENELTPKKISKADRDDIALASEWNRLFKNSMVHKSEYTKKWQTYFDAYNGDYFKNDGLPDYRSDMVSNYIFSVIETVRPIMLDNDPKFQVMPRQPEGLAFSNDLQEALMYEWDREKMNPKMYRELINTLVTGNAIFFVKWDSDKKVVESVPVNPFNLFVDPLATNMDDAEYVIYATYKNVELIKRLFPEKADKLTGGDVNYSELVHDNDKDAQVDNQILILEVWTKDYESDESGDVYPKGRVITLVPEFGVVLANQANPYEDQQLPFVLIKDYDVPGKFWGEGEVAQLLSPQKYMNELNNAIIDNAKATANMPWIIDKNSGIANGKITARPGLIIRKNPGSEVRRDNPPSMPMYVANAVETYKGDIEMISGIHNTLRGENATGVYTAQGILALQEAGQIRIRLKVKLLEMALGDIANLWVNRMKQFWKEDKWITISKFDGSYDMKNFTKNILEYDYEVKITAGSTMPVNRGAMLDLMIRLAQTQMPDGQPLVDREAVVNYLPEEVKAPLLQRMGENGASLNEIQEAIQMLGQQLQELTQGLEEVSQQSDEADEEMVSVIEDITSAVEEVRNQILQLQEEYDKMVAEDEEETKIAKIKEQSYNEGYKDAEGMTNDMDSQPDVSAMGEIPDEVLSGLEGMSDDELSTLMEEHPDLMDMLQ